MGGVETLMIALASIYRHYGHECEIFFFEHGPMEPYLPKDCVVHFGGLADCMRLVRSRGFDVVHANSTDWEIGMSALHETGAKLILTSHGWVVPGWTAANCDALAGCAEWLAREQQEYADFPIQVVLNGVDTDKFKIKESPATAPPIVAWVGRGVALEHKRIDKLAAIAPALHKAGVRLRLVEPYGPDKVAEVTPEAVRILRPLVESWGRIPVERMPDFYQEVAASGGCLVSTSSYEGLPMTLLEAQACGCPVIGPDVCGVNECLDPAHGSVLYPFEMEADKLANLVIETLRDTERMRWRSEACARYMREQFSLQRMAEDYLCIYQEAPYPQYTMTGDAKIYPASKRLFDVPSHLYRQAAESGARWLYDCLRSDRDSAAKYKSEWRFFLGLFRYRYRHFMEREGQGGHRGRVRAVGEIARFARTFVKSKAARSVTNTVDHSALGKAE